MQRDQSVMRMQLPREEDNRDRDHLVEPDMNATGSVASDTGCVQYAGGLGQPRSLMNNMFDKRDVADQGQPAGMQRDGHGLENLGSQSTLGINAPPA